MYLAALGRQNSPLSTYFIASADGVGGGGAPQKSTLYKTKNLTSVLTFRNKTFEELRTSDRLDLISPV